MYTGPLRKNSPIIISSLSGDGSLIPDKLAAITRNLYLLPKNFEIILELDLIVHVGQYIIFGHPIVDLSETLLRLSETYQKLGETIRDLCGRLFRVLSETVQTPKRDLNAASKQNVLKLYINIYLKASSNNLQKNNKKKNNYQPGIKSEITVTVSRQVFILNN